MARKVKHAAALLASQRRRVEHTCPVCSTMFEATTRAVYCKTTCKLKAQRERRAARAGASAGGGDVR
jgi:hypothetical protein